MSMATILQAALAQFAGGRVFPDIAPEDTERPYITWQQVGGVPVNFVDAGVPGKKNARVQVNVWAATRLDANDLSASIEDALRGVAALQTTVLGAAIAVYEPDTKLKGCMQDFSFWN
jgi:hypothetical protein